MLEYYLEAMKIGNSFAHNNMVSFYQYTNINYNKMKYHNEEAIKLDNKDATI